jgi:hypothetical protein
LLSIFAAIGIDGLPARQVAVRRAPISRNGRISLTENGVIPTARLPAFTVAPHLQPINYRGCFSPFAGI